MRVLRYGAAFAVIWLIGSGAPSAYAANGKPGLWDITLAVHMNGSTATPDMSEMPPDVRQKLRAMHVVPSGNDALKMQQCLTPAQAASGQPAMPADQSCKMTSGKTVGKTFTGDMTCSGQFEGTGHVVVTYRSHKHSSGQIDMKGTVQGQPIDMRQTFEGRWSAPDCGAPPH